jgi:hypothetical protein
MLELRPVLQERALEQMKVQAPERPAAACLAQ